MVATNIAKLGKISVIAAIGRNRELGYKNRLLWVIPDDLKRFKSLTTGHPIIMGLNTFRSIGRPLPDRTNIVMSREGENIEGVVIAKSLEKALEIGSNSPGREEIFIIGGGQVYSQAVPIADRLYLTLIDAEAEADTYFPDYSTFTKEISRESSEFNGLKYSFVVLEKPR